MYLPLKTRLKAFCGSIDHNDIFDRKYFIGPGNLLSI